MRKLLTILFMLLLLFFAVSAASPLVEKESAVKDVLKYVSPSIVKVVAENHKRYVASGIALAPDRVISSLRVIRQPYRKIYITTVTGDIYPARVLGKDGDTSLLLLDIGKKVLTPIPQAKSAEVGDWAGMVGVFYRKFPAIYQGIVSSVSDNELIINGPVTPGSPGGAVVNRKGELMGVIRGGFGYAFTPDYIYKDYSTEFTIRSSRNRQRDLCYSIPASKVKAYAVELEKYGKVRRGWLGATLAPHYGTEALIIDSVSKGSPAETAGIRKGDKLLKIKGEPVRDGRDVVRLVKSLKPGQKVRIELLRGQKRESVIAVVGELKDRLQWQFPTSPGRDLFMIPERGESLPRLENFVFNLSGARTLGVEVVDITPELARKFNVKDGNGLMISRVYQDTAAHKAGFQPADIIVKIGDKAIRKNSDLRVILKELKNDEPLEVQVYRKGTLKTINVVPDMNTKRFLGVMDRVLEKMRAIQGSIDGESRMRVEEAEGLRKTYTGKPRPVKEINTETAAVTSVKEPESPKDIELKKYKEELERMKKEQEKLKKEMEKMRKFIEASAKKEKQKKKD